MNGESPLPSPPIQEARLDARVYLEGGNRTARFLLAGLLLLAFNPDRLPARAPSPGFLPTPTEVIDFGGVPVGQTARVVRRYYNRTTLIGPSRGTLYASWTPPDRSNLGNISPPIAGPFQLSYGQRWELRSGEGQNVAIDFVPTAPGTFRQKLYLWWDRRTRFEMQGVLEFVGTGVSPPPPPPPPGGPPTEVIDFRQVVVGQAARVVRRYYNDEFRFGSTRSTLYASWSPPDPSNFGNISPPVSGPFQLSYGQRWELRFKEGQNVAFDFVPRELGTFRQRLYIWWDRQGRFKMQDVFDLVGTGAPTPPPQAGSTSGRQGGLESVPLWMFSSALPAVPGPGRTRIDPPPLWKMLPRLGWSPPTSAAGTAAEEVHAEPETAAAGSTSLSDLIPSQLDGLSPAFHEPESVLGNSNAQDALAADYVDPATGAVRAVVLVFRTRREVYSHSYAVCSRVKGGWLEELRFPAVPVPGSAAPATFWESTLSLPDAGAELHQEVATGFAVYVSADGSRFTVDSHWLSEQYAAHALPEGEVLSFQVWAPDAETAAAAREAVLDGLAQRGTLEYRNRAAVSSPDLFLATASYDYGDTILWAVNNRDQERTVELTAVTWSAANPQSEAIDRFTRRISPGTTAISLPIPGRLNGVVYLKASDSPFVDMVYVADGFWYSYGEADPPSWSAPECPPTRHGPADLPVAGCARLVTPIPAGGWRGLGRALTTYTRHSVDLSGAQALSFFAQGPADLARVQLTALDEDGRRLVYTALFTPSPEGRQITIPFTSFDGEGDAAGKRFTGSRLVDVAWSVVGSPHESTDLLVGNLFFSADLWLDPAPVSPFTADSAGPYVFSATFVSASEEPSVTLAYRRRGAPDFVRVPMRLDDGRWIAEIPGQPPGTSIEAYLEARDEHGRVATSPPDAPFETHSFVVSTQPTVLLDDFEDDRPRNRQGGLEWTFRSPTGAVQAEHTGQGLHLSYDVRGADSFSGWVSPFRRALDTTGYDALVLRIRGARGGERVKIGLGDSQGREHKVVLAKFLERGITTGWRVVQIPLAVFTTVDRRAISKLLFAFENRLGADSGALDVDDVSLLRSGTVLPIPVEDFDDGATENALGGSFWATTGSGARVTAVRDPAARYGRWGAGYRIIAEGPAGSWATAGFDLRGLDLRPLRLLTLQIRGARGGERPNLYLVSGPPGREIRRFIDVERYTAVGTSWKLLSIPLEDFRKKGIDLSNVRYLEIVWEGSRFSERVDIDEIRFQGGS